MAKRLSEEEKIIRQAEKDAKKRIPKLKKEKIVKVEKSEADLVRGYANKVIKNSIYHGRVDESKFKGMEHTSSVSKNLWMDQDFFFSVVFQSGEQKREFLKKFIESMDFMINVDEEYNIQILNGLDLAEHLGISLKPESSKDYPTGNIDVLPFVLDSESIL